MASLAELRNGRVVEKNKLESLRNARNYATAESMRAKLQQRIVSMMQSVEDFDLVIDARERMPESPIAPASGSGSVPAFVLSDDAVVGIRRKNV